MYSYAQMFSQLEARGLADFTPSTRSERQGPKSDFVRLKPKRSPDRFRGDQSTSSQSSRRQAAHPKGRIFIDGVSDRRTWSVPTLPSSNPSLPNNCVYTEINPSFGPPPQIKDGRQSSKSNGRPSKDRLILLDADTGPPIYSRRNDRANKSHKVRRRLSNIRLTPPLEEPVPRSSEVVELPNPAKTQTEGCKDRLNLLKAEGFQDAKSSEQVEPNQQAKAPIAVLDFADRSRMEDHRDPPGKRDLQYADPVPPIYSNTDSLQIKSVSDNIDHAAFDGRISRYTKPPATTAILNSESKARPRGLATSPTEPPTPPQTPPRSGTPSSIPTQTIINHSNGATEEYQKFWVRYIKHPIKADVMPLEDDLRLHKKDNSQATSTRDSLADQHDESTRKIVPVCQSEPAGLDRANSCQNTRNVRKLVFPAESETNSAQDVENMDNAEHAILDSDDDDNEREDAGVADPGFSDRERAESFATCAEGLENDEKSVVDLADLQSQAGSDSNDHIDNVGDSTNEQSSRSSSLTSIEVEEIEKQSADVGTQHTSDSHALHPSNPSKSTESAKPSRSIRASPQRFPSGLAMHPPLITPRGSSLHAPGLPPSQHMLAMVTRPAETSAVHKIPKSKLTRIARDAIPCTLDSRIRPGPPDPMASFSSAPTPSTKFDVLAVSDSSNDRTRRTGSRGLESPDSTYTNPNLTTRSTSIARPQSQGAADPPSITQNRNTPLYYFDGKRHHRFSKSVSSSTRSLKQRASKDQRPRTPFFKFMSAVNVNSINNTNSSNTRNNRNNRDNDSSKTIRSEENIGFSAETSTPGSRSASASASISTRRPPLLPKISACSSFAPFRPSSSRSNEHGADTIGHTHPLSAGTTITTITSPASSFSMSDQLLARKRTAHLVNPLELGARRPGSRSHADLLTSPVSSYSASRLRMGNKPGWDWQIGDLPVHSKR